MSDCDGRRLARRAGPFLTIAAGCAVLALAAPPAQAPLVTGKTITPRGPGETQSVGSLPMNLVLSPDGQYAIVSDMGFRQSLTAISVTSGRKTSEIAFPNRAKDPRTGKTSNGLYYGLAFSPDGALYAAQGANDSIAVVSLDKNGILKQTGVIDTKLGDFPAGLAAFTNPADRRVHLAVANNDPGDHAQPASIAIYDCAARTEVGRYVFDRAVFGPSNFPLAVAALADGGKVFVGSQRDGRVWVFDASRPDKPTLTSTAGIATGAHPIGLLLNKARTLLFVANAHSDTVSVIDTATGAVVHTVLVRPNGARGLVGATPTNLALSPDEKTLYVTLSDMNAVAVVDATRHELRGYIPAGWYPTGVVVSRDNRRLLVCNAKGTRPRNPNPGHRKYRPDYDRSQYGLNLLEGNVQTLAVPDPRTLAGATKQVIADNRLAPAGDAAKAGPLDAIGLKAGKIEHVIYVIKENRTYDQVLGDAPKGDGDPSLTLFGRDVTPNQHALADRFVLLDNFFVCGEASGDGWPWSTQGIANEYVVKNLAYSYSGRGRNYDFEGTNDNYPVGGFPAKDPDGNLLSTTYPEGLPAISDVTLAPGGHIWDVAERAGLSIRNYGMFLTFAGERTGAKGIPDNYPASPGLQPAGHDLAGLTDWDFRRFDGDYADGDAPSVHGCEPSRATYGKYNVHSRVAEWKREFDLMLARDPAGRAVPNLMLVRLGRDHTQGLASGKFSPRSQVADNDYALGQLVETVSRSPIWKKTAIFVLEDDAQDGPDHVDSHRSICFVVSPWIRKGAVDHTFRNTDSVLRSIELLLGLPAMSQYDAVADPIDAWAAAAVNDEPYTAIRPAKEIVCEKTTTPYALERDPALRKLAALSDRMELGTPDSADPRLLNEIIWKSVKGAASDMPAPRRGLIVAP